MAALQLVKRMFSRSRPASRRPVLVVLRTGDASLHPGWLQGGPPESRSWDLAQPALGPGSYVAHDITLQRPHLRLRFTTFVEIMAPCFSRLALKLCRPYLGATVSSWGPNHLFPKLLGYPKRAIAVVDATPVIHTRPAGGGPNSALTREQGLEPSAERDAFLRAHGLTQRFETWAGIDLVGRTITSLSEIDHHKAPHA